jgi:hypothetical protein
MVTFRDDWAELNAIAVAMVVVLPMYLVWKRRWMGIVYSGLACGFVMGMRSYLGHSLYDGSAFDPLLIVIAAAEGIGGTLVGVACALGLQLLLWPAAWVCRRWTNCRRS